MSRFKWISLKDPEQTEWALGHLAKKGLISRQTGDHAPAEELRLALTRLDYRADAERLQLTMRRAWYAYVWRQRRKNEGYVQRLITMEKPTAIQLKKLARRNESTIQDTITDLVKRADHLEADAQQQVQQAKATLKAGPDSRHQSRAANLEKKLKEAKSQERLLWTRISNLAEEMCCAEAAFEAHSSGTEGLTDEQIDQAKSRAEKLSKALRWVHKRANLQTAFGNIFDHPEVSSVDPDQDHLTTTKTPEQSTDKVATEQPENESPLVSPDSATAPLATEGPSPPQDAPQPYKTRKRPTSLGRKCIEDMASRPEEAKAAAPSDSETTPAGTTKESNRSTENKQKDSE